MGGYSMEGVRRMDQEFQRFQHNNTTYPVLNKMHQQRLDVQGLRAVAIAAVLLFHVYPSVCPNGYLGVDMFFVISGNLIFTIFSRALEKGGKFRQTTYTFYYRRFARIIPLSALYTCVAVLLFSIKLYPEEIAEDQKAAWYSLLFITNIVASRHKSDYFMRVYDDNPFTHMWSLSVEIQFYLVVPLLFLVKRSLPPAFGSRFFPAVAVFSLIFHLHSTPSIAFNNPMARLWQFLTITFFEHRSLSENPGQIILPAHDVKYQQLADGIDEAENLLEKDEKDIFSLIEICETKPANKMRSLICLVAFAAVLIAFIPLRVIPNIGRPLVTLATALIICFGEEEQNPLLTNSPMVFIGDVSYSLYLIHWPFSIYLARWTKTFSCERENTIILSLLTTALVYHAYEKHYRKWSKKVCLLVMIGLYISAVLLIVNSPFLNRSLEKQEEISKEEAIKKNDFVFHRPAENLMIRECRYEYWRNFTLPEHKADIQKPFGTCRMPPGHGKLNFLVIGNSYAPNQADLVWKAFFPFFGNFTLFSQMTCEVLAETSSVFCARYANYSDVLDTFKPDVVFVIQRYVRPKSPLPPRGMSDPAYVEMEEHLDAIVNKSKLWFIMNSFPAFKLVDMWKMNAMIHDGKSADEINNVTVLQHEDPPARFRTQQLIKHCGDRCRLYDVEPGLLDNGKFAAYDGSTSLALFEPSGHLTPHGKKRIEPCYRMLANEYGPELMALGEALYPTRRRRNLPSLLHAIFE